MPADRDFYAQNGIGAPDVTVGNTFVTNTSITVGNSTVNTAITSTGAAISGTLSVIGNTTFSANVTGPGTTTRLDGFLIDCGTW
jgi:hypothetical protein